MAKRDFGAEIEAKRRRLKGRGSRFTQFQRRADALVEILHFFEKRSSARTPGRAELVKYLPIGWVACIEGYFRLVYRDLIDHGPPYRDNAAQLKDLRIGIEHAVAMHAGKFTLGEFVAHLLPIKGWEDITSTMSTLLGFDYFDALKALKTNFFDTDPSKPAQSLEDMRISGGIVRGMDFLFSHRHVFAHELAPKVRLKLKDVFHHSRGALVCIVLTETLVDRQLNKKAA